jgi:hypothetical protein
MDDLDEVSAFNPKMNLHKAASPSLRSVAVEGCHLNGSSGFKLNQIRLSTRGSVVSAYGRVTEKRCQAGKLRKAVKHYLLLIQEADEGSQGTIMHLDQKANRADAKEQQVDIIGSRRVTSVNNVCTVL